MNNRHLKSLYLLCLAGLLVPLVGCLGESQPAETINEPPFIPAIEAPVVSEDKNEIPALYVGAYADLMDYGDQTRHNPKLLAAVGHAIRIGVLRPAGVHDQFNPNLPINFTEFRQWATDYQAAESASKIQSGALGPLEAKTASAQPNALQAMAAPPDALSSPMNPAKLMILPTELQLGTHTLENNRPLNREELCALYVYLAQKQPLAHALSLDQIENASVDPNMMSSDEALSMFRDYTSISDWAKPYVAIAYQDGMLQKTFRLSGTQLTIDQGFDPLAPVNREAAIMLLNQMYGHIQTPVPKASPAKSLSAEKAVSSDPGMRGHYTPKEVMAPPETPLPKAAAPAPLKNLKTLTETGPSGSKNVRQTERAE